jgi:hypothetical protein
MREGVRAICLLTFLILFFLPHFAAADSIVFQGSITQSTADGTGPAVNNVSLNSISDSDAFTVSIDFAGSITSPGTFPLSGDTVVFTDINPGVIENNFGVSSITVSADGAFDDISFSGCLLSGSGCLLGNALSANFQIPAASLNFQNVGASTIFGLTPALDLLEDDGTTDIQGSVSLYSYRGIVTSSPEPSTFSAMIAGIVALAVICVLVGKRSA